MRILIAASLGPLALAATFSPAAAQSFDQNKLQCVSGASAELRVAGCTALIESTQVSERSLAAVHGLRGHAYLASKNYARAIADFSKTIQINPQDAEAFNERGIAYHHENQDGLAIADYDEAIRLRPQYAGAFVNRSVAEIALGRTAQSKADLAKARSIDPKVGK
jgi:tetratricopeptide (TPR) repeat protein